MYSVRYTVDFDGNEVGSGVGSVVGAVGDKDDCNIGDGFADIIKYN